ncbi:MAG: alkaline phosphatase [Bacteroidales bacterium]|nr:alkaline phosphatase [Bacteroidales bacterium]
MKRNVIFRLFAVVLIALVAAAPVDAKRVKYVFYMIGDGMGINHVRGTEIFNRATGYGPAELNFSQFPYRTFITTHSASSLVTDSAAAGTALATGTKTNNNYLGVDAEKRPLSSIAMWAKASGYGAGVATCVGVNHATPGAFYANTESRSNYELIAEQLIASPLDFAAGGGFINQKSKTGHDSAYLENLAAKAGITVLHGKGEFTDMASRKGRVICLGDNSFNETDLPYAVDHQPGQTKLVDFTNAAIDYLYGNYPKGFFLMVEGGSIDHAGHNDDPVTDFQETNDFAEAIDAVLAFYRRHAAETVIIVTADHETGGLMLGAGSYEMKPSLLAKQKYSENGLTARFRARFYKPAETVQGHTDSAPMAQALQSRRNTSWEAVKDFLKEELGMWDTVPVSESAEAAFKATYDKTFVRGENDDVVSLYATNTRIVSDAIDFVSKAAGYSWAHGSHTGSPVPLFAIGAGALDLMSCRDNTDIPKALAKLAGYKR